MSCLVRLSQATFVVLRLCFVVLCEEETCSKDGQDCGDEGRSAMMEREDKISTGVDGGPPLRTLDPPLRPPLTLTEKFRRTCLGGVLNFF